MGLIDSIFKKYNKFDDNCDYIVFDLETTGLSCKTCEIIEISAIKIKNNNIIDTFSELAKPSGSIDPVAQRINKITENDLEKADKIENVMKRFLKFIGEKKLVGYNINNYDIPILKRYLMAYSIEFINPYEDVYPLARKKITGIPNYRLSTVASYLCLVPEENLHRALPDCRLTKACYENLLLLPDLNSNKKTIKKKYHTKNCTETSDLQALYAMIKGIMNDNIITDEELNTLAFWLDEHRYLNDQYPYCDISKLLYDVLEDGIIESTERQALYKLFIEVINPTHDKSVKGFDFNGKNIVLTGDFEYGSRNDVESYIISIGGIPKSGVSSKIDFLIVGNNGSPDWSYSNYGGKVKKAKELQSKGNTIMIITETDFFNNN